MAEKSAAATAVRRPSVIPWWLRYVVVGCVAGLVICVASLFVVSVFYGAALGLSPLACAAASCVLTLLLSQPAGLAGMVAGATVGAVAGVVVWYARHRGPNRAARPSA
jgi:hypothetical protein